MAAGPARAAASDKAVLASAGTEGKVALTPDDGKTGRPHSSDIAVAELHRHEFGSGRLARVLALDHPPQFERRWRIYGMQKTLLCSSSPRATPFAIWHRSSVPRNKRWAQAWVATVLLRGLRFTMLLARRPFACPSTCLQPASHFRRMRLTMADADKDT